MCPFLHMWARTYPIPQLAWVCINCFVGGLNEALHMQGSFAGGSFAAYNPYEREVELSEVPGEDAQ